MLGSKQEVLLRRFQVKKRVPQTYLHQLIIFSFIVVLPGCAPRVGDSDAELLLEDIVAGDAPSRLKAKTAIPTRRTLNYYIDGRHRIADLYLPSDPVRAGIVVIPGVVADGKDDKRVIALANTLARLLFSVLVPEVEGLRRFHTRASDIRVLADAFRYLVSIPELAPEGRTGFGGFSYGVGVVMLASLEEDIREQVRYILGFGGYYDMHSVVTYFTTGYYRDEMTNKLKYRFPHDYLKWVFIQSNSDLLERADDAATIRTFAESLGDDTETGIDLNNLAPDARALYEFAVMKIRNG